MPKPNDRIGPYELIRKLGKGAFGEVWLAHDVDNLVASAPAVALKLPLDDDVDLDAIRQEATVWVAASGHPNVLPMLEARLYNGQVVIASEYAPDGSLQQWLKTHGGKAPSQAAALEMTRGILAGLSHLHSRRIVHRDLKPDNILLKGTTPRLADFGLSRVLRSTSMSAVVAGTPVYMAPEAFKGKRNYQTDIWSVGVMLYQLLSGRFPFLSNDKYELYVRITNDEPAPIEAPPWLQQVVAKALSKNPAERFQTAEEMSDALVKPIPTVRPKSPSTPEFIDSIEPETISVKPKPRPVEPTPRQHLLRKPELPIPDQRLIAPLVLKKDSNSLGARYRTILIIGLYVALALIGLTIYRKMLTPVTPDTANSSIVPATTLATSASINPNTTSTLMAPATSKATPKMSSKPALSLSKPTPTSTLLLKPSPSPVASNQRTSKSVGTANTQQRMISVEVCSVSGLLPVRGRCTRTIWRRYTDGLEPIHSCDLSSHEGPMLSFEVCSITGLLPNRGLCTRTTWRKFPDGKEPKEQCSYNRHERQRILDGIPSPKP